MRECGIKCGITTAPACGKSAVQIPALATLHRRCIIISVAAPLPILAGGQRPGEVPSDILGGRCLAFFIDTFQIILMDVGGSYMPYYSGVRLHPPARAVYNQLLFFYAFLSTCKNTPFTAWAVCAASPVRVWE